MTEPFRVILADPAWKFGDKLPGPTRGAESQYSCMSIDDIYKLELPPIADDALLFLWRVAAMQEEALNTMHMWGFTPKSEIVWVKTRKGVVIYEEQLTPEQMAFGMGRYTRHCHEVCLIGARGKAATQVVKDHGIRSVFCAERQEHSRKPEALYNIIEKLADGPYVELFARQTRPGWTSYGDALGSHIGVIT